MTTDNVNPDAYDPDAPPERESWDFIGVLEESKQINNADEADAAGFGENYRKYVERASRSLDTPVWFLKARGLNIQYDDGSPYYGTDLLPLKDKKGRWLAKEQAPDQVATQFRTFGCSASPSAAGSENSAVGRAFHFRETELKLGKKGYTKVVSLYPIEAIEDPSSVQVETILAKGGSEATPEAPADASPEETRAVAAALNGKTRDEVFQTVMSTPALKGIARVLGQDLIAAATDESLPDLLIKGGYLQESDGVLTAVSA